jgi:hypothetical protein
VTAAYRDGRYRRAFKEDNHDIADPGRARRTNLPDYAPVPLSVLKP